MSVLDMQLAQRFNELRIAVSAWEALPRDFRQRFFHKEHVLIVHQHKHNTTTDATLTLLLRDKTEAWREVKERLSI